MTSRIKNPHLMAQLVDFGGLNIDGRIYPTDIDGIIEYKNTEYIIFEIKYKGSEVSLGQRLALERMVNDFETAGKRAVVMVCEHTVADYTKPVFAAFCKVREVYCSGDKHWRKLTDKILVREAIDKFQNNKETEDFLDGIL